MTHITRCGALFNRFEMSCIYTRKLFKSKSKSLFSQYHHQTTKTTYPSLRDRAQKPPKHLTPFKQKWSYRFPYLAIGAFSVLGFLDRKEETLELDKISHELQQAIDQKDRQKELECMKQLGEAYLRKNTPEALVQSAALYNYALRVAENINHQQEISHLEEKLTQIEQQLIYLLRPPHLQNTQYTSQFHQNRKSLTKLREDLKKEFFSNKETRSPEQTKAIYHTIAESMRTFTAQMLDQSQIPLGPPPCTFAVISLGSLSREEATPYSDLEFAFLIEKDTPRNRKYFENLARLLHLRVVNLGETVLHQIEIPCLREGPFKDLPFFDQTIPKGLAFDGEADPRKGHKTPFGNRTTFNLIQTPQKMADFQGKIQQLESESDLPQKPLDSGYVAVKKQWWFEKEPYLPMELLNFGYITGDKQLVDLYQQAIDARLQAPCKGQPSLREYLAKNHLIKQDEDKFNPRLEDLKKHGQLLKVKDDLYRFPHLAIERLSIFHALSETSTFDKIEALARKKVISEEGAKNLKWLISETMHTRLEVYSHYGQQKDEMNPLLKPFQKQFALDKEGLQRLKKIYQVMIPFYRAMKEFLAENEKELFKAPLNDKSPKTQGDIASRLLQSDEAIKWYKKAINDNPEDSYSLNALGVAYYNKGNLDEAIKLIKKALKIDLELFGENNPSVARDYNNLGSAYYTKGDLDEAIKLMKKTLKIDLKLFGKSSPNVAKDYNNLGGAYYTKGDLGEAIKLMKKALEIDLKLYGESSPNVAIRYNNLSLAYQAKGNVDEAIKLIKKTLEIDFKCFGENNPNIAIGYNNLGSAYYAKKDLHEAIKFFNKALEIDLKCFGENNPNVARDYNNLGNAYHAKKDLDEAIKLLEKALRIYLKCPGDNSPNIANIYNSLGGIYHSKEDLDEAIKLYNKALEIDLKYFGKNSHNAVTYYINLGGAYKDKGDLHEAIKMLEKAYNIAKGIYEKNHPMLQTIYRNLEHVRGKITSDLTSNKK